jgi:predicted amidohydrolase
MSLEQMLMKRTQSRRGALDVEKINNCEMNVDDANNTDAIFIRFCNDSLITITSPVVTKVIIERCVKTQVRIQCDVLTGTVEIIRSNDCTVSFSRSSVKTIQVDSTTNTLLEIKHASYRDTMLVSTQDCSLSLVVDDGTAHARFNVVYPPNEPKDNTQQYRTLFHGDLSGVITEKIIREGGGYATTASEKQAHDSIQAIIDQRMEQLVKATIDAPSFQTLVPRAPPMLTQNQQPVVVAPPPPPPLSSEGIIKTQKKIALETVQVMEERPQDQIYTFIVDESNVVRDSLIDQGIKHPYHDIKVLVIQSTNNPINIEKWFDDIIGKHSSDGRTPDFIILPEYWHRVVNSGDRRYHQNVEKNATLIEMRKIAAKYQTYIIAGSMVEANQQFIHNTCAVLGRDGSLLGSYRKRALTTGERITAGRKVGIFDTIFGRVAIMICFDVEQENLMEEVLAYKPQIIFNPTLISASGIGNDRSAYHSRWRVAVDSMSRKFERKCVEHGVHLIRCDVPMHGAMGSSQMIGPYRTVYSPTFEETQFTVYVDKRDTTTTHERTMYRTGIDYISNNDYSTKIVDSSYIRSDDLDNIHNGYNVYSMQSNYTTPVVAACFLDKLYVITASAETIDLFSVLERKLLHSVKCSGITCLAGKANIVYSAGKTLTSWKVVDKKLVHAKSVDLQNEAMRVIIHDKEVIIGDAYGVTTFGAELVQLQHIDVENLTGVTITANAIVTSSNDIKIWSLETFTLLKSIPCEIPVKTLKRANEEGIVYTQNADGSITVWDIDAGQKLNQVQSNTSNFVPWNRSKFISTQGITMEIMDITSNSSIHHIHGLPVSNVTNDSIVCFESDDANRIVVGTKSENFNVFVYEFTSNRVATNMVTSFL